MNEKMKKKFKLNSGGMVNELLRLQWSQPKASVQRRGHPPSICASHVWNDNSAL